MVPVVHDADTKRLRAIAREISDLAARARGKKLSPDDIAGGTFTITNPGPFGTTADVADHQPAAGGDPLDRRREAPSRRDRPPDGSEGIAIHSVGNLALTWDHRAFDGAYAGVVPARPSPTSSRPATGPRAGVTLRVRWLGRVRYREAHALQRALLERGADDHLLLLEHPHVYTLGVRADLRHVLVPPHEVGADLVRTDRGGDVTYHGPGQLVGYPILTVAGKRGGGRPDTVAYVRSVEQVVIDTLADLGLPGAARLDGYPGVWIDEHGAQDLRHRRAAAAAAGRCTGSRSTSTPT